MSNKVFKDVVGRRGFLRRVTVAAGVAIAGGAIATPSRVLPAQAAASHRQFGLLRPDLNGQLLRKPGNPMVYLIDQGSRRWIPDPYTYNRLFRSWDVIVLDTELDNIDRGPDISHGALLAHAPGYPPVYLVDPDYQVKRWISSPAAMDAYSFAWNQIQQVDYFVLSAIPDGPQIDA
jgi:hypothetical protein